MNIDRKHVAVIGAGVAGLTAADALAGWGAHVSLFEKTPFLGGHAIQLNCKATDACVKCGACVAEDKLRRATRHPNVEIHTGTQIEAVSGRPPYQIAYRTHSPAGECRPMQRVRHLLSKMSSPRGHSAGAGPACRSLRGHSTGPVPIFRQRRLHPVQGCLPARCHRSVCPSSGGNDAGGCHIRGHRFCALQPQRQAVWLRPVPECHHQPGCGAAGCASMP